MSGAVFQSNPAAGRIGASRRATRLPPGYGLAIGAAASMLLWCGIFWIAARALG